MADIISEVTQLHKSYQTGDGTVVPVLRGVDLKVEKGEIIAITGESGSGKSTLLNILGGLDGYDEGTVIVANRNLSSLHGHELDLYRNKMVGFIFQFHYLLPDFTTLENVMLPFLASQFNREKAKSRAEQLLSKVGLSHRLNHYPTQLSGGEQQRTAIARALMNEPLLILADEPTGNLDENNSAIIQNLLWELSKDLELTIIIVTHNAELAARADRHIKLHLGKLV